MTTQLLDSALSFDSVIVKIRETTPENHCGRGICRAAVAAAEVPLVLEPDSGLDAEETADAFGLGDIPAFTEEFTLACDVFTVVPGTGVLPFAGARLVADVGVDEAGLYEVAVIEGEAEVIASFRVLPSPLLLLLDGS